MTRRLPRLTGAEISNQTSPRPVLIALPKASRSAELARALELAGIPAVTTCDAKMLVYWQRACAARVVVLDLAMGWAMSAGQDFARDSVRVVGLSNDEIVKLRALRVGFLEVIEDTVGRNEFALRISALTREPVQPTPIPSEALGPLRVDPLKRLAYWRGAELRLSKQPFDLLVYLADRVGVIVPKEQIKHAFLWADDNTLHQAVWDLKRCLGHEAARHIVNRHGYGYGFLTKTAASQITRRESSGASA